MVRTLEQHRKGWKLVFVPVIVVTIIELLSFWFYWQYDSVRGADLRIEMPLDTAKDNIGLMTGAPPKSADETSDVSKTGSDAAQNNSGAKPGQKSPDAKSASAQAKAKTAENE